MMIRMSLLGRCPGSVRLFIRDLDSVDCLRAPPLGELYHSSRLLKEACGGRVQRHSQPPLLFLFHRRAAKLAERCEHR